MSAELTPLVLAELRTLLERRREHLRGTNAAERTRARADGTMASDLNFSLRGDLGEVSVDRYAWDAGHRELLDGEA
jgi:hypothetical protein